MLANPIKGSVGHFTVKSKHCSVWVSKMAVCVCGSQVPFSHVLAVTRRDEIENSGSPRSSCWGKGNCRAGRLLLPIMTGWASHACTHHYTHTHIQIYTQRLSVRPIPPNGRSLILLTGARGGNEVCHLYIHDPWMTSLPHSTPPSWPGNGTLLGWEGGDRGTKIGSGIPFQWDALMQTPVCWVYKSPHKWGQS